MVQELTPIIVLHRWDMTEKCLLSKSMVIILTQGYACFRDDSIYVCVHAKSLKSCLTLCGPVDYTPPGSSVLGILQARILEWATMPSSRGSSWPRNRTCVPCITCTGRWIHYHYCHDKPRQCIKKQRHHFAHSGPSSQSYGFSRSHIWKAECCRTDDFELGCWRSLLRVPWKSIQSQGNQPSQS